MDPFLSAWIRVLIPRCDARSNANFVWSEVHQTPNGVKWYLKAAVLNTFLEFKGIQST